MGIFRHPGITLQLQSKIRLAAPGGQLCLGRAVTGGPEKEATLDHPGNVVVSPWPLALIPWEARMSLAEHS
jgi:hypothetical protein